MESLTTPLAAAADFLRRNGLAPLSRDNWMLLLRFWKFFVLVAPVQLTLDWYPMGKTSTASAFNVNGRAGWVMQELVAPLTLLATIHASPARARADGRLPVAHLWLAGLFCAHYLHRSLLSPLRNPSMAPTHALLTLAAVAFNLANGSAIGAWLGGYGSAATVPVWQLGLGSALFLLGLCGNVYHEEVLRDIRRTSGNPATSGAAAKDGNEAPAVSSADGQRLYKIPQGGLFAYCYYPHYLCEWVEWAGFVIAGGGPANFLPATLFLANEIATMGPRALQGKRWYLAKFGDRAPRRRSAVVPGVL